MKKLLLVLFILVFIAGCTKMQDKKNSDSKTTTQNNQQGDPHSGMNMNKEENTTVPSDGTKDAKAEELTKTANDFDKVYEKDKSEANKKKYIDQHLTAGLYLTYEANLNPKDKYGPALKHFNKVLEADPKNQEALQNKQQIESIYEQMGRPIPQ
jgi:tetratricopeptide (TPR) repeat protein